MVDELQEDLLEAGLQGNHGADATPCGGDGGDELGSRIAVVQSDEHRTVVGVHDRAEPLDHGDQPLLDGSPVDGRPEDEVAAWLNRVTINLALNRVRAAKRHDARVAAHGQAVGPDRPETPEDVVTRDDERRRVRAVLAGLPERQAVALLLRHSGHSYAEIAAALGVAAGSVGVLLARGERAFRRDWETDHD